MVLGLKFLLLRSFAGFFLGYDFGYPLVWGVTPCVSPFLIAIETCYFEILISLHLECSRLTFLCTYYGDVEPAAGGCRCTHEISLLLVLGLAQFRWFGTFVI